MDTPRAPESMLKTLDILKACNVQEIDANTTRTPTPRTDLEPTKIAKPRTQAMHRAMATVPSDVTKQTFMPKTGIRREEQTTRSEKDVRTQNHAQQEAEQATKNSDEPHQEQHANLVSTYRPSC